MLHDASEAGFVRYCILEYLARSDTSHVCSTFLEGLKEAPMELKVSQSRSYRGEPSSRYEFTFFIPLNKYDGSSEDAFEHLVRFAFCKMHEAAPHRDNISVNFRVVPNAVPATESGLNQTFFKTEQTITHDELRFRSRAEIAIHDELKKRDLLFFPNPAAILGRPDPERYTKREPDFLICCNGRWGILEVSGEPWHSGAISTAKDHDRSRLFQRYGLLCIQHFDSDRCKYSAANIVDEFLSLLSQS